MMCLLLVAPSFAQWFQFQKDILLLDTSWIWTCGGDNMYSGLLIADKKDKLKDV